MTPSSPCKNECLFDNRVGFCTSCGRTIQEIGNWTRFTETHRKMISKKAKERLELLNEGI